MTLTTLPATVPSSSTVRPIVTRSTLTTLLAIVVLALVFRLQGLNVRGFSEDEVAKLHAIEAYRHGQFSANAEHPMLVKLAMWGSVAFAERWNADAPASLVVSPESALRMPNVMAGAATTVAVYGVAALLLDPAAGLMAAFLVAADPTIISVNRLGKEDTFLLFFFLVAVCCYEHAKRLWATNPQGAERFYTLAGACFGLMLASKYMPHLLAIYGLFNIVVIRNHGGNAPSQGRYYGAMVAAFLVANFAILLPGTWTNVAHYVAGERQVHHHGYMYDGQLFVNTALVLLWGVPWTYYLRMVVTKMPTVVVIAAIATLPLLARRRQEAGYAWLRMFVFIQLIGYAIFGAKFQRYALPLFVVIDVLAAVGVVAVNRWILARQSWSTSGRLTVCTAIMAFVMVLVVRAPLTASPHFSTYQNVLGTLASVNVVYPEEAYDYGVREAVADVSEAAGSGAAIVSDADMVVEYYLRQTPRRDIVSRSLSGDGLLHHGEQWVVVQDSHLSFESATLVAQLRARQQAWREYRLHGRLAVQVFRVLL